MVWKPASMIRNPSIQSCNQKPPLRWTWSAKVSASHNHHPWTDLRPPIKICYWWDTHVSFSFAIKTITTEDPELLTIPAPQCSSVWNRHCWNLRLEMSLILRKDTDATRLSITDSNIFNNSRCWASKFNKLLMPLKWPSHFEPRFMAVSPLIISSNISSRHCKKLAATTRDHIFVTMVNKQTYPHIFDHLKD